MDNPEHGADQDSIKPVSSLRSLFESKVTHELGSTTTPTRPSPRLLARHDSAQPITRASLDIPRSSSTWSSSEGTSVQQLLAPPGPPISRPRSPKSRSLQRPLSTNALSEQRSAPLININSPQPSPEPPPNSSTQNPWQSSPARPLTSGSVGATWPRVAPEPPKRVTHISTEETQLSVAGSKDSAHQPRPNRMKSDNGLVQSATRTFPPPINRADKPKIPTKPVSITNKVELEPLPTQASKGISPFSTPPSSDESVGHSLSVNYDLGRNSSPQTKETTAVDAISHSPSKAWSLQGRPQSTTIILPSKAQRPDPRKCGFNAVPERPPELPPRRAQEARIAAVHPSTDLGDSPYRASHNPAMRISPRNSTEQLPSAGNTSSDFLPPPKRVPLPKISSISNNQENNSASTVRQLRESKLPPGAGSHEKFEVESAKHPCPVSDYPDASITNRRPPHHGRGKQEIDIGYDCRHIEICGQYAATAGHLTRAWDIASGDMVLSLGHLEKDVRVTALAFKPGVKATEEGLRLWLGTNYGDIQEVDILTNSIVHTKSGIHERREIVKIYRHQNSMWTLDEGGKLCIWSGGGAGLPDLQCSPSVQRVPRGHTFSIKIRDTLWLATGKDIRVFRPGASEAAFSVLQEPLSQIGIGIVTAGAVISGQLDRLYFGHADGKVSIYSTVKFECLGIVSVSIYKISSLTGAGFHLWAGYNTGMIYVYDTRTEPWTTKKEWRAHTGPVLSIVTDRSSLWKEGVLRVASLGADNGLRFWDGTLEADWMDDDMQDRDVEYCSFREITALVVTWNAGAATPTHLRYEESETQSFQGIIQSVAPPDLLVFGFQELVDLEDKKLTAKNLFKGNKKKDPLEQEHMSRQYRAWRDYLVRCIEDVMPSDEPYHLLHTASMVGLFSCVFIKASQRSQIHNLNAAELKRGMGGLHGNKGALILRFVIDDCSLCLVNCHLAAGQSQTVNRNNDLAAILETAILPPDRDSSSQSTRYVGGGDGSLVVDNEICILNGDLNYRIDTMGRDTVVKAVNSNNLSKLLERDQLLVSRRRNPLSRVRAFKECPITFAPTYKYDVGSDRYDTSEKRRAPAWCDRILYRGQGKIKQIDYRRHELRVSDHRPVSGVFKIRIKKVIEDKRAKVWQDSEQRFAQVRKQLSSEAKIEYLRDVLGVSPSEAKQLL